MDYRILFTYRDSSTREVYCSTEADVLARISSEMRSTLRTSINDHHMTVSVTNIALQGTKEQ